MTLWSWSISSMGMPQFDWLEVAVKHMIADKTGSSRLSCQICPKYMKDILKIVNHWTVNVYRMRTCY